MKKYIFILCLNLFIFLFAGCDSKKELYKQVNSFVEQLDTYYEHYDMFGKHRATIICNERVYSVTPMGRLINVKIESYVPDSEYEKLCKSLEKHFKGDKRVNKVIYGRQEQ